MLEVTRKSRVYTARDEHVGNVDRIVLDPLNEKMTHIVVRKGTINPEDKLVRTEDISTATPERINLRQDVTMADLPPFVEQYYVPLDDADKAPSPSHPDLALASMRYGPPGLTPPTNHDAVRTVSERNIPDRLAALAGAPVFTSDRHEVGRLERVVTTDSGLPTHVVVRAQGLIPKDRAIPTAWIEDIGETAILLGASRRMVDAIPPLDHGS